MKNKFKTPSKKWRLNWYDLLKGLVIAIITPVLDLLYQMLKMFLSDQQAIDFKEIGTVAAIAAVGYLLKQFGTGNKLVPDDNSGGANIILLIGLLSLPSAGYCIKPVPVPDTLRIPNGSTLGYNLIKNDIKGTLSTMVVTSVKYKTVYYPINKEITISGFGTIKVSAAGEADIKVLTGVTVQWPEIRYILNDGATGNGQSAPIVIIGTKNPPNANLFREGAYYRYIIHPCVKVNNIYRSMVISGHLFYCGTLEPDTSEGYYYGGQEFWIGDPRYPISEAIKETGKFQLRINRADWLFLYQNACLL